MEKANKKIKEELYNVILFNIIGSFMAAVISVPVYWIFNSIMICSIIFGVIMFAIASISFDCYMTNVNLIAKEIEA